MASKNVVQQLNHAELAAGDNGDEDSEIENNPASAEAQVNSPNKDAAIKDAAEFGGVTVQIRRATGIIFAIFGFSVLVLLDGLVTSNEQPKGSPSNTGAAIGIGLTSLVLCVMKYCIVLFSSKAFDSTLEIIFGIVILVLWAAGVVVLTFANDAIFLAQTSTGFFSTWVNLLLSGYYLFSVWGVAANSKSNQSKDSNSDSVLKYKQGVTPIISIALLLTIGVIAQSAIHIKQGLPKRGRAGFALAMAAPSFIMLVTALFMNMTDYGDPNNYFIMLCFIVGMWVFVIEFCTFSEPFAVKEPFTDPDDLNLNEGDVADIDFQFIVINNGFFASFGAFLSSVIILWKSHKLILKYNNDKNTDFGVQGRHIWLVLLAVTSVTVCVASTLECSNFDGCSENRFVSSVLGISFFSTFLCLISLVFCKNNNDLGDMVLTIPDSLIPKPRTTEEKLELVIAIVLFLFWIGAVLGFTFPTDSPFNKTSTGFFFIWVSFIFSALYFDAVYPRLGLLNLTCFHWQPPNQMSPKSNFGFLVILLGLIVQLLAVGTLCLENSECSENEIVGFALIGVSLILVLGLLLTKPTSLGIGSVCLIYILVICTYAALLVLTVILGPFREKQGNGFYASWIVVYGSVHVILHYEWNIEELTDE